VKNYLKLIHASTRRLTHPSYNTLIILTLITVLVIEALSHIYVVFGKIGTIFWACLFVFILTETFVGLKTLIKLTLHKKYLLTIFAYLIILGISLFASFLAINSHFEAAQETTCKLFQYSLSDFGYNSICHLGYPARIFIVTSLPSLLFGRSLFALNFGALIYIFCGLTIFTAAITKYFKKEESSDMITFFSVAMIPNFFYFNYFLFAYELGIFPVTFMLMQTGFYLFYLKEKKIKYILLSLIVNYYLIFSYTTALAVVVLSLIFMLLFIFEKQLPKLHKLTFGMGIIATTIMSISSLFIRNDIRLFSSPHNTINISTELLSALRYFINGNNVSPFTTSAISSIMLIVILSLLSFMFGKKYFIVGIWIIAVVIAAVVTQGYSFNSLEFRVHRAIIIMPTIIIFTSVALSKILRYIPQTKKIIVISSIFLLSLGVYYQYSYLNTKVGDERHRHYELINYLKTNINNGDEIYLYFDTNTDRNFISINDNLYYYYPKSMAEVSNVLCAFNYPGVNTLSQQTYFLTYSNIPCTRKSTNFSLVGSFKFLNDETLLIYKFSNI